MDLLWADFETTTYFFFFCLDEETEYMWTDFDALKWIILMPQSVLLCEWINGGNGCSFALSPLEIWKRKIKVGF